ncbi:hypothetical protein [Pseudoalteromonas luteoviolacea]|uniref:Uncharacterized protein n=1 Tax=Pseudoalteromonas luteoviolacea DSM 6061 TaxID=1365250 RepID=A0A166X9B6_9GAMM|nr:hypothetical protein [Pseudoalteromonas luteoviolacea]KZN39830.1 hypothetical protein N475_13815 [Pseudoalteromonas luteoviolacea DSM 6061]MBE0385769.1 hypothetical protein [Pseudoalteromonas luteoviolacea DSM 6061]
MSASILEVYSHVFSRLKSVEILDKEVKGKLNLTEELASNLMALEKEGLTSGAYNFTKRGKSAGTATLGELKPGHYIDDVEFEIDLSGFHETGTLFVCRDWNEFLSYSNVMESPKNQVFFTSTGELLSASSKITKFENYHSMVEAYQFIKSLANSTEGGNDTIIYERPLKFDFTLTEADLEHPVNIDALKKLQKKDLHTEAIHCLICQELVSFLKDKDVKKRFSYLVQNMDSLTSNILLSYQSYVENYTFDKVRKEYLEKRTEYISKVHDTFDSVATKLLSLPAGVWFATSEIEVIPVKTGLESFEFVKNVAVLCTMVLAVILLTINLLGQFSSLRAIRGEYTEVFKSLEHSFEEEKQNIKEALAGIESARTQVCIKLGFSIFASISLLALAIWIFCKAYPW